jgi:ferritin-like metal-binding protein YciE
MELPSSSVWTAYEAVGTEDKATAYTMRAHPSIWARLLNHGEGAQILQQTLNNEEGDTDKALTRLAETINVEAES